MNQEYTYNEQGQICFNGVPLPADVTSVLCELVKDVLSLQDLLEKVTEERNKFAVERDWAKEELERQKERTQREISYAGAEYERLESECRRWEKKYKEAEAQLEEYETELDHINPLGVRCLHIQVRPGYNHHDVVRLFRDILKALFPAQTVDAPVLPGVASGRDPLATT